MISRTIVVNAIESTPLSLRSPLGVELDLEITFRNQDLSLADPAALLPQLALLPRSRISVSAYDVNSIGGGVGRVQIPGNALGDVNGYNLELYQRRTASDPANPPVPVGLLARGVLKLEGSAYTQIGPLGMISVPVITGPAGETGPAGPAGEPGLDGRRGSVWTTGTGTPTLSGTELPGDMYLDENNGDVWRFNGAVWMRGTF